MPASKHTIEICQLEKIVTYHETNSSTSTRMCTPTSTLIYMKFVVNPFIKQYILSFRTKMGILKNSKNCLWLR